MNQSALAAPRLGLPGQRAHPRPPCLDTHCPIAITREEGFHGLPEC